MKRADFQRDADSCWKTFVKGILNDIGRLTYGIIPMQKSPKITLGGASEVFLVHIFFANTNLRIGEWMGGQQRKLSRQPDSKRRVRVNR